MDFSQSRDFSQLQSQRGARGGRPSTHAESWAATRAAENAERREERDEPQTSTERSQKFRALRPKRIKQNRKRQKERLSKVVSLATIRAEAARQGLRHVRAYSGNMRVRVPVLLHGGAHIWIDATLKIRPQARAKVHSDVALVSAVKPKGSKHFNLSQEFHPAASRSDKRKRRKLTYESGEDANKWLIPVKQQFLFHR